MKNTVIVIVGPTAVGKTALSLELAKSFAGEIISGDSMQVYKGLNIGTAKITEDEKQGIPHYMIDILHPDENFSIAQFQTYVRKYIKEISGRKKMPILVGGSGLYIESALLNYNFTTKKRNTDMTKELENKIKEVGIEPIFNKLKQIDPEAAKNIHPNNHRRIIRALEVYKSTGKTMTEYQAEQKAESLFHPIFVGLEMDRQLLYERINMRVDQMLTDGLLGEVRELYDKGFEHVQSMKAIGYKEFIPYFKGEQSLERSIELLKRNSRRFAKRQYTWFKNRLNVTWYDTAKNNQQDVLEKIKQDIKGVLRQDPEDK